MRAKQIQAISFDAAGTLFHLRESVGAGYSRVASQHGFSMPHDATDHAFRSLWKSMPPMGTPIGAHGDRSEKAWWRELVAKVTAEVSPAGDYDFEAYFTDLFAEYAKPELWELYPETLEVLERVALSKLRLFVLSNFDSRLLPVLKGLEVADCFEKVFYSGEIGTAKPNPEIFAHMLSSVGLHPQQVLHVGDDPVADWEGAKRAGLEAFELDRKVGDLRGILDLENLPDFSD